MARHLIDPFDFAQGKLGRRTFLERTALLLASGHAGLEARATPQQPAPVSNIAPEGRARIRHLRLVTRKLDALRTFYSDTLGLPLVDNIATSATFQAGQSLLQFDHTDEDIEPVYHFAFTIPENKIERALDWMTPRARLIAHRASENPIMHFPQWNAHSIHFLDPARNLVELIARHGLANTRPGQFESNDLLSISEIGIVVPTVRPVAVQLRQRLGLAEHPGASRVFTPLGDDHGLLLIVETAHVWFPTDFLAATAFPTTISLIGPREDKLEVPGTPVVIEVR